MPKQRAKRQFKTNQNNNLTNHNPVPQQPSTPREPEPVAPNFSEQPQAQAPLNPNPSPKPDYPHNQTPNYQIPPTNPQPDTNNGSKNHGKHNKAWYKQPIFWIIAVLIIVVAAILLVFLLLHPTKQAPKTTNHPKSEQTTSKQLPLKKHPKTTKVTPALKKDTTAKDVQHSEANERQWKNPGSYDNMKYETDDFTLELNNSADGVKLISDANNKPALYIEYTITNNSKQDLKPADVVSQDLQLKQDNQILNANNDIGDNQDMKDRLNTAQQAVAAGQKAQAAMLYSVNNTKDQISMFFMNLKTKQPIATTQPFKL